MQKHVLLVDDDQASLEMSRRALEQSDHAVTVASTGVEACRALRAMRFDVVVTDIFMPDLDGLELIRLARIADPKLRIVAMSDYDRHSGFHVLAIAKQLGADATLQKPIEIEQLLSAVAERPSAASRAALREEESTNAAEF